MDPIKTLALFLAILVSLSSCEKLNNRPIIGVLAETTRKDQLKYGYSFISSSYVKLAESGGARVVPIKLGMSDAYYKKMFNSINGLIVPGGGQNLTDSPYQKVSSMFFDMATEAYTKNDYFPILAICLGFEMLNVWAAQNTSVLQHVEVEDMAIPLILNSNTYNSSRMFGNISPELLQIFKTENVTSNYHRKGVTPQSFAQFNNSRILTPLSFNVDFHGKKFISTVEGVGVPLYGLQWHPEKNIFIFTQVKGHMNTPHDEDAVSASQYIANFFIKEARKSHHNFSSLKEEQDNLIYNYSPVYVGKDGSLYEQLYIFPEVTPAATTTVIPSTTPSSATLFHSVALFVYMLSGITFLSVY